MKNEMVKQLTRIADALEVLTGGVSLETEELVKHMVKEEISKPEKTKPVKKEKPTLTHDDLKAACLAKSREDASNKPKLKALLGESGASKAVDVPNDKLDEVVGRIEKGDF